MALNLAVDNKSSSSNKEERAQTQIWLNVGYETTNAAGEVVFINLPVGIPIDTTNLLPVRGNNEDWKKFQHARNDLLETLQKHGAGMAAGAEEEVNGLVIRLKRVNIDSEIKDRDNDLLDGKPALFGSK